MWVCVLVGPAMDDSALASMHTAAAHSRQTAPAAVDCTPGQAVQQQAGTEAGPSASVQQQAGSSQQRDSDGLAACDADGSNPASKHHFSWLFLCFGQDFQAF